MGFSQEASNITCNTKAFLPNPIGSKIEHMSMLTDPATKELSMLSYIDQNSDATQRELSEHIGVSLGTINIMVKQLVRKGLVKIVHLQPNSARYFLTPKGIASKIERTYSYIVRSYREVEQCRQHIADAARMIQKHSPNKSVVFYGEGEDLLRLIKEVLKQNNLSASIASDTPRDKLVSLYNPIKTAFVVWSMEDQQFLHHQGYTCTNLLNSLFKEGLNL